MVFLFVLSTFDPVLDNFWRFWTNPEIQDGRHSEMITQLLRPVTSSPHDEDVKGDIFRRTIYPPSLVVVVFIFSELRRGDWEVGESAPSPFVEDQKKPVLKGVNDILSSC